MPEKLKRGLSESLTSPSCADVMWVVTRWVQTFVPLVLDTRYQCKMRRKMVHSYDLGKMFRLANAGPFPKRQPPGLGVGS